MLEGHVLGDLELAVGEDVEGEGDKGAVELALDGVGVDLHQRDREVALRRLQVRRARTRDRMDRRAGAVGPEGRREREDRGRARGADRTRGKVLTRTRLVERYARRDNRRPRKRYIIHHFDIERRGCLCAVRIGHAHANTGQEDTVFLTCNGVFHRCDQGHLIAITNFISTRSCRRARDLDRDNGIAAADGSPDEFARHQSELDVDTSKRLKLAVKAGRIDQFNRGRQIGRNVVAEVDDERSLRNRVFG